MTVEVVAAVDVGGTRIKAGYVDRAGQVIGLAASETPPGPAPVYSAVTSEVARLVADAATVGLDVQAVGLVVPGIVDELAGVAKTSMILGWRDLPFRTVLSDLTQLPIGFGHDVRAAALAEGRIGAASEAEVFIYVSIGSGLGSAIVVNGVPFVGRRGLAGEIAHVVVAAEPVCRCGNRGCLEMISSASAIHRAYACRSGSAVSLPALIDRLASGEALALEVWEHAIGPLGRVLASCIEVIDPDVVVIGGGLIDAGEWLLAPLREASSAGVSRTPPPIVAARHGPLSGLVGAGLMAWDACSDPEVR